MKRIINLVWPNCGHLPILIKEGNNGGFNTAFIDPLLVLTKRVAYGNISNVKMDLFACCSLL